jgi:hypothetical protein
MNTIGQFDWIDCYFHVPTGRLIDENGDPIMSEVFASRDEAEKYILDNDIRATVIA